ncbi:hypothetical protein Q3G72_009074 [Acer saccharum]|nr:hypothetical protein Q3G72_009074 [Acer saccharum]
MVAGGDEIERPTLLEIRSGVIMDVFCVKKRLIADLKDKFSTEMEEDEASPLRGSGLKSTGLTVSMRKEASGNRLQ